jgi:hypothetical protein
VSSSKKRLGRRWHDAIDPAPIEILQRECPVLDLSQNLGRDEIARDHKKDVDADKSARKQRRVQMVEQDGQHCDGTQAVYVRPIVKRLH